MMQLALTEPITVHCFFVPCAHVVQEPDPISAHDAMEQHYAAKHATGIARIVGDYGP